MSIPKPDYSLIFTDNGQNIIPDHYKTEKIMRFLAGAIAEETGRPVALCKGHPLPCNILEKFGLEFL